MNETTHTIVRRAAPKALVKQGYQKLKRRSKFTFYAFIEQNHNQRRGREDRLLIIQFERW